MFPLKNISISKLLNHFSFTDNLVDPGCFGCSEEGGLKEFDINFPLLCANL